MKKGNNAEKTPFFLLLVDNFKIIHKVIKPLNPYLSSVTPVFHSFHRPYYYYYYYIYNTTI